MELFRKIPPVYSPYYKTKISKYFSNFEVPNKTAQQSNLDGYGK